MFSCLFSVLAGRLLRTSRRRKATAFSILALLPLLFPAGSLAAPLAQTPPGGFAKITPADGAVNQNITMVLQWTVSPGATDYQICIDNSDDDLCISWQPIGNTTTFLAAGLNAFTTYYWQVGSSNLDGDAEADSGVWWSFTTGSSGRRVYLPLSLKMSTVDNGDFEQGPDIGWMEYSLLEEPIIMSADDMIDYPPHSGEWAAWLGFFDGEQSQIYQTVSIPDNATTLTFWYWIDSEGPCGLDSASVYFNGHPLTGFYLCSNNNTNGWVRAPIPVSQYRGQTGLLEFWVVNDPSETDRYSSLIIDDVSIE